MLMSIAFGVAMGEAEPDSAAGPSPAQTNRNQIMVRIRPFIYVVLVLLIALGGYFFVKRLIYAQSYDPGRESHGNREITLRRSSSIIKELERTPDDFALYMKLGKIYMTIGEKKKAREHIFEGSIASAG